MLTFRGTINDEPKILELNIKFFNDSCNNRTKIGFLNYFDIINNRKLIEENKSLKNERFVFNNDSIRIVTYPKNEKLCFKFGNINGKIKNSQGIKDYDFKMITLNPNISYCYEIITTDTIGKNRFSDEDISVNIVESIRIFNDQKMVQEIKNINEEAYYFDTSEAKTSYIRQEDYNNDNYLDIILTYSPKSRLYDSDEVIFLFDPKLKKFSDKKLYKLKNLSDEEYQKRYGPGNR